MSNIDTAVNALVLAIKESETYLEYKEYLNEVKKNPELKQRIDEYRTRNFEMQNSRDYNLDKVEQFDREYDDLLEDQLVIDFLASEVAFCRMMQDSVLSRITGSLNFD